MSIPHNAPPAECGFQACTVQQVFEEKSCTGRKIKKIQANQSILTYWEEI